MVRVAGVRTLPGCAADLAEPTALVDIDCGTALSEDFGDRLRTVAEPLFAEHALPFVEPRTVSGSAESLLGEWIVALVIGLQQSAGDPVWRGTVLAAGPGRLRLAIPWRRQPVLAAALDVAVRLVEQSAATEFDDATLRDALAGLAATRAGGLEPDQFGYVRAAAARGIPIDLLAGAVQLGWGAGADRMRDGQNDRAGFLGVFAADNRLQANQLMANAVVPLPDGEAVQDFASAERVAARTGWPVVVKPVLRRDGSGALTGIADTAGLERAFRAVAETSSRGVIVERQIDGDRHRLLTVNGQLLIAERRVAGADTATEVTAAVHPDNRLLAARVARIVGLRIATVEFVSTDISRSWRETGGAVCEVNPRAFAAADPARDVDGAIIDLVFEGRTGRIPTAAITGSGAAAVAVVLHHIWLTAGAVCGVCTAGGVWIGRDLAATGDRSGQPGGRILLTDPAVQAAVIEMPGRRATELGHPCDRYDVAAVVDVDGQPGDRGSGCAEILERTVDAVVLAADDPQCEALLAHAGTGRHILVGDAPRAGECVTVADHDGRPWLVHAVAGDRVPLMPADEVPSEGLRAAMFAAALALAQGLDATMVARALRAGQSP